MFNQRLAYIDRLQLVFVYVFMCNTLETMKNKHEMPGKGKTVVFPCDNYLFAHLISSPKFEVSIYIFFL